MYRTGPVIEHDARDGVHVIQFDEVPGERVREPPRDRHRVAG